MFLPWIIIYAQVTRQRQNRSAPWRAPFILGTRSRVGEFVAGSPASWSPSIPGRPPSIPLFPIPLVFNPFFYLTRLLGMNSFNFPPPFYLHVICIPHPSWLPFHFSKELSSSCPRCWFHILLTPQRLYPIKHLFFYPPPSPQSRTVVFPNSKEILQLQIPFWLSFILISFLLSLAPWKNSLCSISSFLSPISS